MAFRCLIVDDSSAFLEAARTLLEKQGVTVQGVASNGAEAIRQVQQLRPELALVDINLGGESGLELARQLTRDGLLSPSQVIAISTHAEADFADLIAESPVAGFLAKSDLSADAIRKLLADARQ
jgi:DNA-binding NarL/FixJ family response regulator